MTLQEKLQALQEIKDPSLKMNRILADKAIAEAILKMSVVEGPAGKDGYTPQKGKDYYTEAEINSIINYIQSNVKDGKDGESIKGDKGIPGDTPLRGVHYWTTTDQEQIVKQAVSQIPTPKDGISPDVNDIIKKTTEELKKVPVHIKDIKGTEQLISFLKSGGFRGGGLSAVAHDSTLSGDGTTGNPLKVISSPGIAIGETVTGGTKGSVLFVNPAGILAQDNTNLFFNSTAKQLELGPTPTGFDGLSNITLTIGNNVNSYSGAYFQNASTGVSASTDLIVGADNDGVALVGHYSDMGVQGDGWLAGSNPLFNGFGPNEGYFYTSGGNVNYGTDSTAIKFFVGGFTTTNEKARLNTTGLGLLTTAPTHTLTLGSTGTGIAAYNTSDQTTNYQRVTSSWRSNNYELGGFFGGTGTGFPIRIGNSSSAGATTVARYLTINNLNQTGGPAFDFINPSQSTAASTVLVANLGNTTITQSTTVTPSIVGINPTISQTSSAGYRALWISPFENTVGSGSRYLIDAGTNSAANGGGTHTSVFNVTSNGTTFINGNTTVNATLFTNNVANGSTANNAQLSLGNNGSVISRNVADANAALIVNLANASASGFIQQWQFAGSNVGYLTTVGTFLGAGIANTTGTNSQVLTSTTGTVISRNIADANAALIVNQVNASSTGKILDAQFGGVSQFGVTPAGAVSAVGAFTGGAGASNNIAFGIPGTTNFSSYNSNINSTTDAKYLFQGATNVSARSLFGGNISTVLLNAGDSYGNVIIGSSALSTPATGTNAMLASLVVRPLGTVTNGGSTVSATASLYIDGASAGGTNNYAIYAPSGAVNFGGNASVGGTLGVTGNATFSGFLGTTGAFSTANFLAIGGSSISSSTNAAGLLFGGASSIQFRAIFNGGSGGAVGTNLSAANAIFGTTAYTVAASGVVGNLSNAVFNPIGTVTNTSAITVSETSTVLINGAGTGATVTSNNYALKVASGVSKFGGVVRINGYTVATLPAGVVGDTAYVTDSSAPTFGATAVGGGAIVQPVFYNGANWITY